MEAEIWSCFWKCELRTGGRKSVFMVDSGTQGLGGVRETKLTIKKAIGKAPEEEEDGHW
jgi:hypothetical protein